MGKIAHTLFKQASEKKPKLWYWAGGGLATARRQADRPRPKKKKSCRGGKRDKIKGFSRSSRRRLMRELAKVLRSCLPLFLTLTYPSEYPSEYRVWKAQLRAFYKRIRRRWPRAAWFWRLEFQKRGAPHFHLLMWGVPYHEELKAWVSNAWYEVVASGDIKHLRAGTNVQKVRSWKHMMAYASKVVGKVLIGEVGKDGQAPDIEVGRWWGVEGAEDIPWAVLVSVDITHKMACNLIRYFRRHGHIKSRAYESLTVFLDVDQWASKLGWMPP